MDDGKTPPKKLNLKWDQDVVYLPFTSTSGVSKGIMHTHKSLLSCFYSPEGAANHWFDQTLGDSVACGVWFFHNTGLYAFALASIYGLSLYTLSEYSDSAFLDLIVDNKIASAALYPWQVRVYTVCATPLNINSATGESHTFLQEHSCTGFAFPYFYFTPLWNPVHGGEKSPQRCIQS